MKYKLIFNALSGKFDYIETADGNNTEIQFNDNGSFGGDSDLKWNKTTNTLTINGAIEFYNAGGNKTLSYDGTDFDFNDEVTVTNGTIAVSISDNTYPIRITSGVETFSVEADCDVHTTGDMKINDNHSYYLGNARDSYLRYDGSTLFIKANDVTATDSMYISADNITFDVSNGAKIEFDNNGAGIASITAGAGDQLHIGATSSPSAIKIDLSQNIHTVSDSNKLYFGTSDDAYIEFDGNSLNIVANAVTADDTLEITGRTNFTRSIASTGDQSVEGVKIDTTYTGTDGKTVRGLFATANVDDDGTPSNISIGVQGSAQAYDVNGVNIAYGGKFDAFGSNNFNYGVYASASPYASGGTCYAVYGYAIGGTTNYGGYFDGSTADVVLDNQTLKVGTAGQVYTLPSSDGSNGDHLKTNGSGTLSWTAPPSAGASIGYDNSTDVNSGANSPTSWTDLDLSGVVGAKRAIVALRFKSASDMNALSVRPNGDTSNYYNAAAESNAYGTQLGHHDATADLVLITATDTAGIVEWITESSEAANVYVLWYLA